MSKYFYICAILATFRQWGVEGYGSRVPIDLRPEICSDMIPRHEGVTPQTTPHKYKIEIRNRPNLCYSDTSKIVGEIVAEDGSYFEGFMVQARPSDGGAGSEIGVGHFCNRGLDLAERLTCNQKFNNTLGHRTSVHRNSTFFDWHPDYDMKFNFRFVATLARNKTTIWTQVKSEEIRYQPTCVSHAEASQRPRWMSLLIFVFVLSSIVHL